MLVFYYNEYIDMCMFPELHHLADHKILWFIKLFKAFQKSTYCNDSWSMLNAIPLVALTKTQNAF